MPGSSGAAEGILAISRAPTDDDAVLDLALGQLATVAGLALEGARLRARVDAVTKAREALLASVSHDLRNPLNTFAMSAGLLRDDLERNDIDAARGISLISRMERATSRMQSLIEDLVEASRIDARKIDLVMREEKAAQLVKDAALAAMPAPTEKGAAVTCEATDDDARVLADRTRTLQALAKVIAFEAKATGDGGAIRLGVARQGDDVVFTARALRPWRNARASARGRSRWPRAAHRARSGRGSARNLPHRGRRRSRRRVHASRQALESPFGSCWPSIRFAPRVSSRSSRATPA